MPVTAATLTHNKDNYYYDQYHYYHTTTTLLLLLLLPLLLLPLPNRKVRHHTLTITISGGNFESPAVEAPSKPQHNDNKNYCYMCCELYMK